MQSRRHHLVPRFYLRRWANNRDQVLVVPRDRDPHLSNVADAIVENDFYTVDVDSGPSDEVEVRLSEIEGQVAPAITSVVEGAWPISDEHRGLLANFAALQLARGWQLRGIVHETTDKIMKMSSKMLAAHPDALKARMEQVEGRPVTNDEVAALAEFMSGDEYSVVPHRNEAVISALQVASKLVDPLFAMTWDVIVAGDGAGEFFTGDLPAAMWRKPGTAPEWQGIGVTTCDEITLPIGRRCALLLRWNGGPAQKVSYNVAGVAVINHRTMNWCRVLVLHPDQRRMVEPVS